MRASHETGGPRSELLRHAVQVSYGREDKEARRSALRASAGSWKGRRGNGADYVNAMRRSDLSERLSGLGGE